MYGTKIQILLEKMWFSKDLVSQNNFLYSSAVTSVIMNYL